MSPSMHSTEFVDVLSGKVQPEHKGNLAQPWVKLSISVIPFGIALYLVSLRGLQMVAAVNTSSTLQLSPLVAVLFFLLLAQSLDFRASARPRTVLGVVMVFSVVSALVMHRLGVVSLSMLGTIALPILGTVSRVIAAQELLTIAFLATALRGFLRIYPTDAIAISSILFWKPLIGAYQNLIVMYYVLINTVERRFFASKTAMVQRFRLMRAERSWISALYPSMLVFLRRLVREFLDAARLSQAVLADRGWYDREFSHTVAQPWNYEDVAAVLLMMIGIAVCILLFAL